MTYFFASILPIFYMMVFLTAFVVAVRSDHVKAALYLTILFFCAWVPAIWEDALTHMLANLLVFTFMLFTYTSKAGTNLTLLTLGMVLTNGTFSLTEYPDFYRLSIINLLFLAQCITLLIMGYTPHKTPNERRDNGNFMAKVLRGDA